MVCEAHGAALAAPDRVARCRGALRKRWAPLDGGLEWLALALPRAQGSLSSQRWRPAARRAHPHRAAGSPYLAALAGILGESADEGSSLGRAEQRADSVVWAPAEGTQSSPRREPGAELAPVTTTGSLVGRVVDPLGRLGDARLLVRDSSQTVVRECYPTASYPRFAPVPFEVHGLPADTYTLELTRPGFCQKVCRGVRVEPSCVTNVGTVLLTGENGPRRFRLGRIHSSFLHPPPPRGAGRYRWRAKAISAGSHAGQ